MSAVAGLGAALLMSGEMSGKPGMKLTSITHEHSFSSQMMVSCYSKIFKELGLGDIAEIHTLKQFKPLLKEANQRGNNIYS
jgi:hypothetical protein